MYILDHDVRMCLCSKRVKCLVQQNLWLFPRSFPKGRTTEHMLTEVGTMNLFVFWKTRDGQLELVTPPLDGTILPGVTRDSILQLSREWKEFRVSERPVSIQELCEASDEGRIVEMFGSGTAAIVSPIKKIRYVLERDSKDGRITKFKVICNIFLVTQCIIIFMEICCLTMILISHHQ